MKATRLRTAFAMTVLILTGGVVHAQQCGWEWVNPAPPRHDIYRLKYESNYFLGVGAGGTVLRSLDGYTWDVVDSGVRGDLFGVAWGVGSAVIVGEEVILRSASGNDWTVVYTDSDAVFLDVEYSVSRFVAVGTGLDGEILLSSDGIQWEGVPVPWARDADSVTETDEGFAVAVGTEIWTSPNGSDWSFQGTIPVLLNLDGRELSPKKAGMDLFDLDRIDLAWTGTRLVWVGGDELWTQKSGSQWELISVLSGCATFRDWLGIYAGAGWAMASGISGCPSPFLTPIVSLSLSTDGGKTFQEPFETDLGGFPAMARFGSRWIVMGALGDLMISSDAAVWERPHGGCTSLACADELVDLTGGDDRLVAVGGVGLCDQDLKRVGGRTTAISGDGVGWTIQPTEGDRFRGVTWTGFEYLAVGEGWIARSDDGIAWSNEDFDDGADLRAITAGNGWVVAVGAEGDVYVSSDTLSWTKPYLYYTEDLERVVWDGDQFLVLGENGLILRSPDALNWTPALIPTDADLKGAAAGPAQRVVVGEDGVIFASSNGEVWLPRRSGVSSRLNDVTWAEDRFVAVGWDEAPDGSRPGVVLMSGDGDQWTRISAPGEALHRVRKTQNAWVTVGGERSILSAECLGVMMGLDTPRTQVRLGESVELEVHLSPPATFGYHLAATSSHPGKVIVTPSVMVPAYRDSVVIRVSGAALIDEAELTLILPESVGGGTTSTLVTVHPPEWTPRKPSGRVSP